MSTSAPSSARPIEVSATIENNDLTIPMIGFNEIPVNWSATLDVTVETGDVTVDVGGEPVTMSPHSVAHHFTIDACRATRPLALHLIQRGTSGGRVRLFVVPTLTVAHCDTATNTLR